MRVQQRCWSPSKGWSPANSWGHNANTALVLVFGPRNLLAEQAPLKLIRDTFPNAQIVGCSTAGEISGITVDDDMLVFTAVEFEHTRVRVVQAKLDGADSCRIAGQELALSLAETDLVHVLVFSQGLHVNGTQLLRGLTGGLPATVAVTGGLAGDGADFKQTLVHLNGSNTSDRIVAIGLYGRQLRVGYGSRGGWDPFGPERIVTRAHGNVLYELDDESALSLYEKYLGDHARDLPASALRFPLSVRLTLTSSPVVRTILAIDKAQKSMTFAGDIVEGTYARLMRADLNRLINGAGEAAAMAHHAMKQQPTELAILVSCVGRKLVLKQRTEDEVEAVRDIVGPEAIVTGFYSYGEICPLGPDGASVLHNQTMTVTTLSEAA